MTTTRKTKKVRGDEEPLVGSSSRQGRPETVMAYIDQLGRVTRADGKSAYPLLTTPDAIAAAVQVYREAVEELHQLRQNGHPVSVHCEACQQAEEAYRAAYYTRLHEQDPDKGISADVPKRDDERVMGAQKAYDEAREHLLTVRRHVVQPLTHCAECAGVRARVEEASWRVVLGVRVYAYAALKRVIGGAAHKRVDLFLEALDGVRLALERFNPQYAAGKPVRALHLDELQLELWRVYRPKKLAKKGTSYSFLTYAGYWMEGRILLALSETYRGLLYHVPVGQVGKYLLIEKAITQLQKLEWPRHRKIARILEVVRAGDTKLAQDVTFDDVTAVLAREGMAYPLDRSRGDRNAMFSDSRPSSLQLNERIPDVQRTSEGEYGRHGEELFRLVEEWVRQLPLFFDENLMTSEREIFCRRLALDERGFHQTYEEIGAALSLSREALRKREQHAYHRLGKHPEDFLLIRVTYNELHDFFRAPNDRLLPAFEPTSEESLRLRRAFGADGLDCLDYLHGLLSDPYGFRPFRMEYVPERSDAQIDYALYVLNHTREQITILRAASKQFPGDDRRWIVFPHRTLREKAFLAPAEILYVLNNLLRRYWLFAVQSFKLFPEQPLRLSWDGEPVHPPDRQVLPFR